MKANKQNIHKIAKNVRKQCENFVASKESAWYDCHNDPSLMTMCAIASFVLFQELDKQGMKPIYVYGRYKEVPDDVCCVHHCWVECGGFIVDITATQFPIDIRKKVVIRNQQRDKNYYKQTFSTEETWEEVLTWEPTQSPSFAVASRIMEKAA